MWNAPFPANRIFFDCHFYITRKIPPWIPCNLWRILDFHKSSLQVLQSLSLPDAYCLRRSLLCLSVTMVVCSVFQSLLNFSPSSVEILRVYLTILLCGLLQAQNFLTPFFHNIQCYTSFLYPFSMNIFYLIWNFKMMRSTAPWDLPWATILLHEILPDLLIFVKGPTKNLHSGERSSNGPPFLLGINSCGSKILA